MFTRPQPENQTKPSKAPLCELEKGAVDGWMKKIYKETDSRQKKKEQREGWNKGVGKKKGGRVKEK